MKKILFLMFAIANLAFVGCSDDDGANGKKLDFIQIILKSDEVKAPEAVAALFYLNGMDIDGCPNMTGSWGDRMIAAPRAGSSDYIFPITDVGGEKFLVSKDHSVNSIYWNELSSNLYGTPLAGGNYVVFVQMTEGSKSKAYLKLKIDSNKKITVHLPKANSIGAEVDAIWNVEDFK